LDGANNQPEWTLLAREGRWNPYDLAFASINLTGQYEGGSWGWALKLKITLYKIIHINYL
jgi:hypothetical protein